MKKLFLIDANSVLHRVFYAIPPFRTPDGELVNAVFGFFRVLINIIKTQPEYIGITFDVAQKTFRHEQYEAYKAGRTKAPQEFYDQFKKVKDIIKTLGIPIYEMGGYEADDVIATIVDKTKDVEDLETVIFSSDQDIMQLVNDRVSIMSPQKVKGKNLIFTGLEIMEKFGLTPEQIVDYKSLRGDSSDNIKGVKGIGEKSAVTLIQKYGDLDSIYEHIDEITGALKNKLENGKEDAYFSKKMVTLYKEVPIKFNLENLKLSTTHFNEVIDIFEQLRFKSLIPTLRMLVQENDSRQTSLF